MRIRKIIKAYDRRRERIHKDYDTPKKSISWSSYWATQNPETDIGDSPIMMCDDFAGATLDTDKWDITDIVGDGVAISQNDALIFTIDRSNPVASTNTNPVDSKQSITNGAIQATFAGTATTAASAPVMNLFSSMSSPYNLAQVQGKDGVAILTIYFNNVKVYEFTSAIAIKNTWKITFDSSTNEVKFWYLNGLIWTQAGTTQTYDIDNGNGLKTRFGANSVAGSGSVTWTFSNFYMTNEDYNRVAPTTFNPSITVISDKLLIANQPTQDNRWYGRPVLKRLLNDVWMMVYANSEAHHTLTWSQLHIRFSNDYGETWSNEDKYLDGSAVTNFPMYPPNSVPGDNANGPGDGWISQCPNSPKHLLLHMWETSYQGYNNGTWQSESLDSGKTWSVPTQITWVNNTGIESENRRLFATCQTFFYNNIIYCAVREYLEDATQSAGCRVWLAKSTNNGASWELISKLCDFTDNASEMGIEYVGNNTIVACIRHAWGPYAYYSKSTDMGATWSAIADIAAIVDVWSRQRVYTRSHIKGTNNWWEDPVLICHGYVHVDGETGKSHPRRLAVWISEDSGETFSEALWLKDQGYDGGYGDLLYNPVKDEYVSLQYYAPTSLLDGEIRQINWKLTL